jgi:hypothetical protein
MELAKALIPWQSQLSSLKLPLVTAMLDLGQDTDYEM